MIYNLTMEKIVYLDHAATTPLDKNVIEKMIPFLSDNFGNANSLHTFGRRAVMAVDDSRDTVARLIGAKPNEIYFTSGGTEGDNWAIYSVAKGYEQKGKHIIISPIEHPALNESAHMLKDGGYEVEYMKVDKFGTVDLAHLKSIVRQDTIFVGCMMANNEFGTIQPIKEIAQIAHSVGAICFTDAVQATGVISYDVKDLDVDMLSMSAHKFYGPKGVGALYVKNGVKLLPYIAGGHQERSKRGGTTNVAGIVGMATALDIALKNSDKNNLYVKNLKDRFENGLKENLTDIKFNGNLENRLFANSNVTFNGISGEALLFNLDLNGVCASNGSACSAGSIEPSRALISIGLSKDDALSTVRFTFGKNNTESDVDYAIKVVCDCVLKLQQNRG